MAGTNVITSIKDLPDVILYNIIAAVSDVRSRNSAALVCWKWYHLERSTRTSLTLRGNVRDLFMAPTCFQSVTHLDLSLLSPWGKSFISAAAAASDPTLVAYLLRQAFPGVQSLTVYVRDPSTLQLLAPQWPKLREIKLVRWHQRPQLPPGSDLQPLFEHCQDLCSLDLSSFYCWTDDIPPSLQSFPNLSTKLTRLNLLNPSFAEGFKSELIKDITMACPNLEEFLIACTFDPRYYGYVGDETLLSIVANCPRLSTLHLADASALSNGRGDTNDQGYTQEDARISVATLKEVFSGLPLLERLALDICQNVRDSGPAFEMMNKKCPKLSCLKLGQFHGICMPVESKLDGLAFCDRLECLSLKNVADLTDMGLIAIGKGCSRLTKFEIQGCKKITAMGMRTLVSLLCKTLVDVHISSCGNLGAASSLRALEPIQDRIQRLHIDCVWDSAERLENLYGFENNFDLNNSNEDAFSSTSAFTSLFSRTDCDREYNHKKRKYYPDSACIEVNVNSSDYRNGYEFYGRTWERLQVLSLWISVGELLTPLEAAGLENCPNLEEIRIKVEGDCRELSKPSEREFGLSSLARYPQLSKMHLDCGDIMGYAQTAPSGQMDLSPWERFYLFGIGNLGLSELDYWLPQDRAVNQRSLSLPAAGLLQECLTLRKLFIHGTAHEHFMMFLLRIPNLRDVQLREDYYPAPETDMSTEMRTESCSRFEAALNRRQIPD